MSEKFYNEANSGWTAYSVIHQNEAKRVRTCLMEFKDKDDAIKYFYQMKECFEDHVFLVRNIHAQYDTYDCKTWYRVWPDDPMGEWDYVKLSRR